MLGWVNSPGAIGFADPISAVEAIAKAGGPKNGAFLSRSLVVRGSTSNPAVAVADLRATARGRRSDFTLQSGDIVWVPKSPWSVLGKYIVEVLDTAATSVAVAEGAALLTESGESSVRVTVPTGSTGSVGIPIGGDSGSGSSSTSTAAPSTSTSVDAAAGGS